jgi:hypothetical protein
MTKAPTSNLAFTIGGTTFTLTPSEYLVPKAQYALWGFSTSRYYTWVGNGGTEAPSCILGMYFLTNFYSVFDTTNSRVGLAKAA